MRSAATLRAIAGDGDALRIMQRFDTLYRRSLPRFQREELEEIALCACFGASSFSEAWFYFVRQANSELKLGL